MRKIEMAIWTEMITGKPFGIWVTDRQVFDYDYLEGYEEHAERVYNQFKDFDFSKVDWSEFWDYWTSKGYNYWLMGPFVREIEETVPEYTKKAIKDLPGLVDELKRKKIKAVDRD